jgi:hypothetical protein
MVQYADDQRRAVVCRCRLFSWALLPLGDGQAGKWSRGYRWWCENTTAGGVAVDGGEVGRAPAVEEQAIGDGSSPLVN